MWYAVAAVDKLFVAYAPAAGMIAARQKIIITIPQIEPLFIDFPFP